MLEIKTQGTKKLKKLEKKEQNLFCYRIMTRKIGLYHTVCGFILYDWYTPSSGYNNALQHTNVSMKGFEECTGSDSLTYKAELTHTKITYVWFPYSRICMSVCRFLKSFFSGDWNQRTYKLLPLSSEIQSRIFPMKKENVLDSINSNK